VTKLARLPCRLSARDIAALVVVWFVLWVVAAPTEAGDVAGAWAGIIGGIIAAVKVLWEITSTAVTVAVKALVVALQWAVTNLTRLVVAGLKKSAVFLARVAKTTWRLARRGILATLKALDKAMFWLFSNLERIFKPLLRFLDKVRGHVLWFYRKYVRPLLDAIEITRQIMRLLAWAGIDWAKAIDRKLQQLEDIITYPFDLVLNKINEIIGIVNRIVTLDGLLQRVVLFRSMVRDFGAHMNLWWRGVSRPLSGFEEMRYARQAPRIDSAAALPVVERHVLHGDSEISGLVNEIVSTIRLNLRNVGGL